jgi:hypothetical protein
MGYSKREIIVFILGLLLAGTLTVWLTIVGLQRYLDSTHSDDPLTKAGGLQSGKATGSER